MNLMYSRKIKGFRFLGLFYFKGR